MTRRRTVLSIGILLVAGIGSVALCRPAACQQGTTISDIARSMIKPKPRATTAATPDAATAPGSITPPTAELPPAGDSSRRPEYDDRRRVGRTSSDTSDGFVPNPDGAEQSAPDVRLPSRHNRRPTAAGIPSEGRIVAIAEDTNLIPFASGPVPRTAAIAGDATLNDITSVGPNCWAVGERAVIVSSSDGGGTWTSRLLPFECSLQSVCFLTDKIGWVAGTHQQSPALGQKAVLLTTRDGGLSWTELGNVTDEDGFAADSATSPQTVRLKDLPGILKIQFFGLTDGIAITLPAVSRKNATIFRTSDGGTTWQSLETDAAAGVWTAGSFLSPDEGIVAGEELSFASVISTRAVTIGRPMTTAQQIHAASLSDDGTAWMAGDGAYLLKSDNAGISWTQPSGRLPDRFDQLMDFYTVVQNGQTVIAAGAPGSAVVRSPDGGLSWSVIPVPQTVPITAMHFLSDRRIIAVGAMGTVLASDDAGVSWYSVRSAQFRSAVMAFTTEGTDLPLELIARASGDEGFRSVAVQMSMRDNEPKFVSRHHASTVRSQAIGFLGGNSIADDWMFVRSLPELDRVPARLLAEWNSQTEGHLRELLPLRVARQIRMWRPSVIVVESNDDHDAVADVMRQVLPLAIDMAAGQTDVPQLLNTVAPTPWMVQRVVLRTKSDHVAPLAYHVNDLLPALATTSGLVTGYVEQQLTDSTTAAGVRPIASYEVMGLREVGATPGHLMIGVEPFPETDARRSISHAFAEQADEIRELVQRARTEAGAVEGHLRLAQTEDSLIASLRTMGTRLPEALALQQLNQLAQHQLQTNRIEGYVATLQEITRRFPKSRDAATAAETLFIYYSSMEARQFRINETQSNDNSRRVLQAAGTEVRIATETADGNAAPPFLIQPKIQSPSPVSFGNSQGAQVSALHQVWDKQADSALQLLRSNPFASESAERILVRQAANFRLAGEHGKASTLLSEVSQQSGRMAPIARTELQLQGVASASPLPVINARQTAVRPYLDGTLTDKCWEAADEVFLHSTGSDGLNSSDGLNKGATLVMMAWDREFVYIAARCENSRIPASDEPLAVERSHDESHATRDRLEFAFDIDRDYATKMEFKIDQTGRTSERCWLFSDWDPEWYVASEQDTNGWRFEAAIPVHRLTTSPITAGDAWGIQLQRIVPGIASQQLQQLDAAAGTPAVNLDGVGLVRFLRQFRAP